VARANHASSAGGSNTPRERHPIRPASAFVLFKNSAKVLSMLRVSFVQYVDPTRSV
jgi:hypothetical protein